MQLYNPASSGSVFAHTDSQFTRNEDLTTLLSTAQSHNLDLRRATHNVLPPSSAQSVLKSRRSVPAVLLSDYDASFTNAYYDSIYDREKLGFDYELGEDQERMIETRWETFLILLVTLPGCPLAYFTRTTWLNNFYCGGLFIP